MKKIFFLFLTFVVALCVPADAFAQSKKKGPALGDCPEVWTKKAKTHEKQAVSTLVADIGKSGIAKSDAPFAVVPILTATAKKKEGGRINVLIPCAKLPNFSTEYAPKIEKGGSAFGGKAVLKPISGVFFIHQGEPVLLVGVALNALEKAPKASQLLDAQIANQDEQSGATKSSKEGYTKKFFNVSKIGKDAAQKREFARLIGLYNKGKKSKEKVKPADAMSLLQDGGDPYIVFEDKPKIEWEIRY